MPLSDASRHITEHIKAFHRNQTCRCRGLRFKVIFKLANHRQTQIKHFKLFFNNNINQLHFLKALTGWKALGWKVAAAGRRASVAAAPGGRVQEAAQWDANWNFKWRNLILCAQQNFELLSKIKGNSINECDCFEGLNLCQGRYLWLLSLGAKKPSYSTANIYGNGMVTGAFSKYSYCIISWARRIQSTFKSSF